MTLMLETLRSDETLDTGCFGVGFLAFALGCNFAADDEFADLERCRTEDISHQFQNIRSTPANEQKHHQRAEKRR